MFFWEGIKNNMIFEIKQKQDEFIQKIYDKSMEELDDFFELHWKRNMPNLFLMSDREVIDGLRKEKNRRLVDRMGRQQKCVFT